jgi:1-acyl-sn-glycerol-3-phosphate acyltransferase
MADPGFFYNFLGATFFLGVRILLEVRVEGLWHYQHNPSTLIIVNHKRDLDVLVVAPTLYFSRGLLRPGRPLTFAAREDLFLPGFLGAYLEGPPWARRLLARLDLKPVLRRLRAAPIRRFPERTLREILFEILEVEGDLPLGACLDEKACSVHGLDPQTPLSAVVARVDLPWLHQPASLNLLREPLRGVLRSRQPLLVESQLAYFCKVLEEGGVVYLAPEGVLSSDGRMGRLRGGLHYLLEHVQGVQALPVALSYDFLTTGRMGVFVAIGPPRTDLAYLPRPQRTREVRRLLAGLITITFSQIAGWVMVKLLEAGIEEVDAIVLEETVRHRAHLLGVQGRRVDRRLLEEEWFQRRWRRFLTFGQRRGVLRISKGRVFLNRQAILQGGHTYRENPIRYAANELESTLHELGIVM